MKKYIKPSIKTVEIESNAILAGSDPSLCNEVGNTGSWHGKQMNDDWDEEDF